MNRLQFISRARCCLLCTCSKLDYNVGSCSIFWGKPECSKFTMHRPEMRGRGLNLGTLTAATNLAVLPGQAPLRTLSPPIWLECLGRERGVHACGRSGSRNNLLTGIAINPLPFCAASNPDASPFLTCKAKSKARPFQPPESLCDQLLPATLDGRSNYWLHSVPSTLSLRPLHPSKSARAHRSTTSSP